MLLIVPIYLWGQKVKSFATIDKDTVLIGDHITIKIEIQANPNTKLSWPNIEKEIPSNIELLNVQPIDTTIKNDTIYYTQNLIITSFDSGFYEIPGFVFSCVDQEDTSFYKSRGNPLFLRVNTLAVDTTQIFMPIKGPLDQNYTFKEAIFVVAGGILILVILGVAIYFYFFRKKKQPLFSIKSKPNIPAHILAIENLKNLKAKKLWQQGKFKEYYTELIDIFRIYIEDRFKIEAMEMTSDEIRNAMKPIIEINKNVQDKMSETFIISDLVKFAKLKPLPEDNDSSILNIELFINNTIENNNNNSIESSELKDKTNTQIRNKKEFINNKD